MKHPRKIERVSVAVLALAALALAWFLWPFPPSPERALHRAIGQTLARQAAALARPGATVVVLTRDTEAFPQPAMDLLLAALERELRRASIPIAAVHRIQVDPLRPLEVPPGDFFEWIRRAPAGQVIVSLLGPPLLAPEEWGRLVPLKPRIVAFCPGELAQAVNLPGLMAAGYVHAAVAGRTFGKTNRTGIPAAPAPTPRTFEELYEVISGVNRTAALRN